MVRVDGRAVELEGPGPLPHGGARRSRVPVDAGLGGADPVPGAVPLRAAADGGGPPARPVLRPRVLVLLQRWLVG